MFTFKRGGAIISILAKHRKKSLKQEISVYFDFEENPVWETVKGGSDIEEDLLIFLHSVCLNDKKALRESSLLWLITVIVDRRLPWLNLSK